MTGKKAAAAAEAKAKSKFPPGRKPHFFKVLLGDFAHELRIPPKFLKHMEGKARGRVTLQGPNGNKRWRVELGTRPQGTFLLTGWPNFVEHHLLEEHDFLIFRYEGKKHFRVLVFDKSGCEKDYIVFCETSEEEDSKPFVGGGIGGSVAANRSLGSGCYFPENESKTGVHVSSLPSQKLKVKTEECNDIPTVLSLESNKHTNHHHRPKQQLVSEGKGSSAQKAANSFRSDFPFFIYCMTASSIKSCSVKVNLVLRDPTGMAWVVLYLPGGYLSAGWRAFLRGNNLEEGDYCAFELVRPKELRANIFKAVQNSNPRRPGPT